jgi:hypothetical protein
MYLLSPLPKKSTLATSASDFEPNNNAPTKNKGWGV